MRITRLASELARSPYYRSRPVEAARYAYAKWVFSRFRVYAPEAVLASLGVEAAAAFEGLARWRPVLETVVSRVRECRGHQGGVSLEDGLVLYGLVRALRPDVVVETGVAAGVSTSFIGAALVENGLGRLYSIELPPAESAGRWHLDGAAFEWPARGVGWAIPEQIGRVIRDRHVLILEDVQAALPALLARLPHVDLFFHDDLHTPDHMLWEYRLVWPKLRPGGVLVSDDVNFGWIRFCGELGLGGRALHNIQRLAAVRKAPEGGRAALPDRGPSGEGRLGRDARG